jgi:hypothetical protein
MHSYNKALARGHRRWRGGTGISRSVLAARSWPVAVSRALIQAAPPSGRRVRLAPPRGAPRALGHIDAEARAHLSDLMAPTLGGSLGGE